MNVLGGHVPEEKMDGSLIYVLWFPLKITFLFTTIKSFATLNDLRDSLDVHGNDLAYCA